MAGLLALVDATVEETGRVVSNSAQKLTMDAPITGMTARKPPEPCLATFDLADFRLSLAALHFLLLLAAVALDGLGDLARSAIAFMTCPLASVLAARKAPSTGLSARSQVRCVRLAS